jgi:hypothetical protein
MHRLRILHNGDLRKETPEPSPHWMVHVREDGSVWGEVLMRDWGRTLPTDFRLPDHSRFFNIPPELREHQLSKSPHHEAIIVSLVKSGGHHECTFLMSDLPAGSSLNSALSELLQKINKIVEQGPFTKH